MQLEDRLEQERDREEDARIREVLSTLTPKEREIYLKAYADALLYAQKVLNKQDNKKCIY